MKLVAIIVGVHAMVMCVACQSAAPLCYKESQYGPSATSPNTLIQHTWDATEGDGVYNATSLCLDENYNVIVRRCFNGAWYPKSVGDCYDFACPKPFLQEDRDKCSYTTVSAEACPSIPSVIAGDACAAGACAPPRKCIYSTADFLEFSSTPSSLNVTLIFHAGERKLLLTVYFPEALDEDLTRCYANHVNADRLQNRKLVNVSKVYDSRRSPLHGRYSLKNFTVYELGVEGDDGPRQYWCQVYQISKFRPLTTPRTVAYSRRTGNEYSLRVNAFKFFLEDALRSFCSLCRVMEVQSFNQRRSVILLHLTTTNGAENVTEELPGLRGVIENKTSQSVELLGLESAEFCLPDVTVLGEDDALLHWKATPLGAWARPVEFCDDALMRKCQGDFLHGAEWGEVQGHCSNVTKRPPDILSEVKGLMSLNTTRKLTNTDALLESLEDYVKHNVDELQKVKKSNLLVHQENSQVAALALYKEGFKRVQATFNDLNASGLELGVFLPENSSHLLVTVFRNDRLFPGGEIHAGSDIVRVDVPKPGAYLKTPIVLLFKTRGVFKRTSCAFWDYGHWSTLGANYVATVAENHTACAFSHLRGYFAVVVSSGEEVIWEDFEGAAAGSDGGKRFNAFLLMVYGFSAVGVAAIAGVVVTAVLVKWCRRKERRK